MLGNTMKPRFNSSRADSNILMTQIRAENKYFKTRQQPIFLNSHRHYENVGKKVFKQNLYKTTILNISRSVSHSKSQNSVSPLKTGKRTGYSPYHGNDKLKGKKILFKELIQNNSSNVISPRLKSLKSPKISGKRRFDQSPTNQNRISPDFCLKINRCDNLQSK